MRTRFAKAKLSFGSFLVIILLTGILLISCVLSVLLFIEPADFPDRVLNCSTVEGVEKIKGYSDVVNAMEYLAKEKKDDIKAIKFISYIYDNDWRDTSVSVRVEYETSKLTRVNYINVRSYTTTGSSIFGGVQTKNHYEIKYLSEDEYKSIQRSWVFASDKDSAYERVERELNEFAIQTIWDKAKANIREEEKN